jgi:TonB family protein
MQWVRVTIVCVSSGGFLLSAVSAIASGDQNTDVPSLADSVRKLSGLDPQSGLDDIEAVADRGDARAQLLLGGIYLEGKLVSRDAARGYAWLLVVAAPPVTTFGRYGTSGKASELMSKAAMSMSESELAAAQQIAAAFRSSQETKWTDAYTNAALTLTGATPVTIEPVTFDAVVVRVMPPALGQTDDAIVPGCAAEPKLQRCKALISDFAKGPHCTGEIRLPDSYATSGGKGAVVEPPEYPRSAALKLLEGRVGVMVHVDSSGWVCSATVAYSSGVKSLDRSALDAVRRWRLNPAMKDATPVESIYVYSVDFVSRIKVHSAGEDADKQARLGYAYETGRGVKENDARAAELYRKAAEQGQVEAQYNLGVLYKDGVGVQKDDEQAVAWFRRAADRGFPPAQVGLAAMYEYGLGVPKDDTQMQVWTRKAADQGFAPAQTRLGYMYSRGLGVPKDDRQAIAWYQKAAAQGDPGGQNNLGFAYETGTGVPKDDAQAAAWYQRAAPKGDLEAQYSLGVMYFEGRGVPKDDAKAAEWLRKAADQGKADAQYRLGMLYETGQGVKQDDADAVAWYRKAGAQGNADAQEKLRVRYRDSDTVQ